MTKLLPCTDDKDKVEKSDYTHNPISTEPNNHHKSKTEKLFGTPLSQLVTKTTRGRSLAGLPPEMIFMIDQYLEPNDVRNVQHTSREFRTTFSGLNKHIIVEDASALLDALRFFSQSKHHKLTFKVTESNVDNSSERLLLESSPQINWSELGSEKLDPAPTSAYGIKELDLSNTNIDDQSLAIILEHAPLLTSLSLSGCKKLSKGMLLTLLESGLLKNLVELKSLDLSYTNIDVESLITILEHLPNLVSINLSGCKIPSLNTLKKLRDSGALENFKELKFLSLYESEIGKEELEILLTHTPELTSLDVSYTELNDNILKVIQQYTPKLAFLNFSGCENIFFNIFPIEENPPHLLQNVKILDMGETKLSYQGLAIICINAPNLTSLKLNWFQVSDDDEYADFIGEEAVEEAFTKVEFIKIMTSTQAAKLQNLHFLDLQNSAIDDESLIAILKHAPNLRFINLENCEALSEDLFFKMDLDMLNRLKNMKELNLNGTQVDYQKLESAIEEFTNDTELPSPTAQE